MEVAIAFSPGDWEKSGGGALAGRPGGYHSSGSHAGRNIELIYQRAHAAGSSASLEDAIRAGLCGQVRHVLICSGFFVLHGRPCVTAPLGGSCETDGPLGALALLRAFAARGVRASLFCDAHNGPVLRAGFDAMLSYFDAADSRTAEALRLYSRCLPLVSDIGPQDAADRAEFDRQHAAIFPGAAPDPAALPGRSVLVASALARAVADAWRGEEPEPIDCLFALERLGAPYRNIRGRDIGAHTEPIDCLWPLLDVSDRGDRAPLSPQSAKDIGEFASRARVTHASVAGLRELAGVKCDAVTLGIGDGGNEVGVGKVAHLDGVAQLKPLGNEEFVPLALNGCYRSCDHLVLSTVSNWGGSAFELGAHALLGPASAADYVGEAHRQGRALADLEDKLLEAVMAAPAGAVDGIDPERVHSVDGMGFDPHHRGLYQLLWALAGIG